MEIEQNPIKSNWNCGRNTNPALWVSVGSYEDVQQVVRDTLTFPSPVLSVGSFISVTDCLVNDGGTIVTTRKLDKVLGLETDEWGRQVVRVQAGCRLKPLNMWLQSQNVEIPFMAEIGEASVGSVTVGDTKESSLNAPGYFSAHVTSVIYVDGSGDLVTLTDRKDGLRFDEFLCSFGLSGVVVEVMLKVRPATLCRSSISVMGWQTPEALAKGLLDRKAEADNLFAIVMVEKLAAFLDQRWLAGPGNRSPETSQPELETFRLAKRKAIQLGLVGVELPTPKNLVYSRADLVNEYYLPPEGEPRLDFSYYEHDVDQLTNVVTDTHKFTKAFQEKTGWAPAGWAVYFVKRSGKKPFGLYSGSPGESLSFDPVTNNPKDPHWHEFLKQYNRLAIDKLGAKVSPIQTQHCQPGDLKIPEHLARMRFTTKYYRQFLAGG